VKLVAAPLPSLDALAPATHTIFFQLAPDDQPAMLCGSVDAVHFRAKGNKASFRDGAGGVPAARGVSSLQLRRLSSGNVRIKVSGASVALPATDATQVRVAFAARALAEPGTPIRCVARTTPVAVGGTGALELP